ncbi:molybdate ABC transporter substrate-binding protein [Bacillaceae bacterium]
MQRCRRLTSMIVWLGLLFSAVGCGTANEDQPTATQNAAAPVDLYVLAAASLTDAMKELAAMYESSHPGQKLVISYGSSGTLQKQIEQGVPADLFVSAAAKNMKELVEKGLIDPRLTADLLTNRLVLISPKDGKSQVNSFEDLKQPDIKRIAIGKPEAVPAGTYAKEALTNLGIWDAVQPKLVYAKDVRQVLSYVESGNVDAGIVYKTDAILSSKVTLAATADSKSHSPIVYPIGVMKNSQHPEAAQSLYNWLRGPAGAAVFAKYGFDLAKSK